MRARRYTLLILLAVFAGCKLQITSSVGGSVTSASGIYNCTTDSPCSIDIIDIFFDDVFIAVPDVGYEFTEWKRQDFGFCGGSAESCALSTNAFAPYPALMTVLGGDKTFYLSPVFETTDDNEEDNAQSTSTTLPGSIILIDVPAGTFTMGGDTVQNDAPEVTVTVSSFKMSEKEITNQEYTEFLNAAYADGWIEVSEQQTSDPCGTYSENMVIGAGNAPNSGQIFLQLAETGGCTSGGEPEHIDNMSWISFNASVGAFELLDATKSDWPANWIKWFGAYAFAQYYSVSLPTESQWEYAARGGQQLQYPTSDGALSASAANYNGDTPGVYSANGHSVAVGSYNPNPFGLYDMGGNVWEWCQDFYSATFYSDGVTDPVNTSAGADSKRVRRGGSWNYHSATLLTYARASDFENRGNNHFGFRIVEN
ncbi:MAG: SUMF1/EgtB/PvdO family nonheme iron enzyme [Halieaceae bacterium]|jgi:formylglycine-generating enzyme|nr:SUMF1/EgtB/PvdO family nonheme iron enzyme [Halieaceae bacterium]